MKQGRTYANSVCSAQKPEPKRVLRAEGALRCFSKQREARADQRAPPAALRGRSPRGRRLGEEHPSHQPGALGSFLGVKAKPLRGRCASLDPHPLRQCPSSPCAGLWRVFEWRAGQGVGAARSPAGRGHGPLTRPERPKPAGRVSGALFPGTPAPRRRPRQGPPEGAYEACGAGGPPCLGFKGAQPLGLRSRQKTLCRRQAFFCSSSFALRLFTAPRRGPKSQRQKGNPGKPRIAGFWASQCNLPRLPCSL